MFEPPKKEIIEQILDSASTSDVERILRKGSCSIGELPLLLSPAAEHYLPQMAQLASELTLQRFGRIVQLYAPLYVSNYCSNNCVYCGFAAKNKITRKCLTFEEAEAEAQILHDRGFQHILLVTGEADKKVSAKDLANLTGKLKDRFASVSIEVQPFDTEEYQLLFEAGITSVAVYQETYERDLYDQLHLSGKKKDYDYRLATPQRACEAGMREVGIGVLLGLGDWRLDGTILANHLNWLRKHYWRTNFTVSFPRLRPATGGFEPLQPVTTRQLSQLIFALRIFDPDVGLIISTREEEQYRDGMVGLGPTRYSAGSSTTPGGYSKPDAAGEQWGVGDRRSLEEVVAMLKEKGFDPVYKDWDSTFQNF